MNSIKKILPFIDVLILPIVYPSAWIFKMIRNVGVNRFKLCKKVFTHVGVFPIRDHYYDPQFNMVSNNRNYSEPRNLPGIEWNDKGQLELLSQLHYEGELVESNGLIGDSNFKMKNGSFESGDFEFLYQMIRHVKPRRIYEIGSGNSTLMAVNAINKNREEDSDYLCRHVCIEPYEMPWLEDLDVEVIREKVEDVDLKLFSELECNDILFIDSSHMIRPEGDVLCEYLQIIPTLKSGVIVHIHDVFTPRNYPDEWLADKVLFWNEQYLLEAFLTDNNEWSIIAALNALKHNQYDSLKRICPFLTPDREPGSFYMQKNPAGR